ncbi:hypothetical protein [Domibacillus iocasae]|uniref:hypothetical protein n=1 Tax=Domibacillus iocasae TaxID=1714016 RepID=UPI00114D050F|nr:hypothetical protein [Domibacillus iocasae]
MMKLCERCSHPLKSQKRINAGMGTVCTKKAAEEAARAEFERNEVTMDEVLNDEKIENAS